MMKKMMMLAAMAMMTAVASAVTITWTVKIGEVDGDGIKTAHSGLFILSGSHASDVTQSIFKWDNTSKWVDIDTTKGDPQNYTLTSSIPQDYNATKVIVGTLDGVNYEYGSFSSAASTGVTFTTDNSSDAITLVLFNAYNTNNATVGWATYTITGINDIKADTTIDLGELGWKAAEANNLTKVVPEPTALALLALGVAGLALKRKVA